MVYWAHVLGSALLRVFPLWLANALADLLAPWLARGWAGHYARTRRNMQRVLEPGADPRDVERRVRNVFRNYARYLIGLLWMGQASREERAWVSTMLGVEEVDRALRRGRGLLIVTAHVGYWDLGAAVLAERGYPVHAIVETLAPRRWNDRVQRIRVRSGLRTIAIEDGAREMYEALRRNEILALVIDRPLREGGVPVQLFGAPTRVPDGVGRLAVRTGASVVAATMIRHGDRFVCRAAPIDDVALSGDRGRDVQAITQAVMDRLAAVIRQYPDQWYMFRDMWPAGPPCRGAET